VIAIFLCVGECEPQLVARGIRRGVIMAEARGSTAKPVLLSLMGTSGLVDLTSGERPGGSGRQVVFPSYRFPEAAVRALVRAVEYAAYRRQPPGRLVWREDVDPAGARQKLEESLLSVPMRSGRAWLEGETAASILGCFGIAVAPAEGGDGRQARLCRLTLRSHPDFGPLVRVRRGGRSGVERVTPLTDQDIRGMLEGVGLPGTGSEAELLVRLSQMVEELPWLVELQGSLVPGNGGGAALAAGVRLAFTKPA
jgi:hypothetical protein